MDKLRIRGGKPLEGSVRVAGAKNAALPILAASVLTREPLALRNVPRLRDVSTMLELLAGLGVRHEWTGPNELRLQTLEETAFTAPYDLVRTMRASILVLGPLLAARGRARVSRPGGCAIGARPVDLHIQAMELLGASAETRAGYIDARTDALTGGEIDFPKVSVTGTENAMMAAVLAQGTTVLRNAAREPEVVDLAAFLAALGAKIEGAGTGTIRIEGVRRLGGGEHEIVPDRIEAGTWLAAAAITGGSVTVEGCRPEHMDAVLAVLRDSGVMLEVGEGRIQAWRKGDLRARDVATAEYPGFPTDMQAQTMAVMTQAQGESVIEEHIFENRFQHVSELARMGARVELDGVRATVHGPAGLQGSEVMATDLRASASLVLAGLAAEGETVLHRVYHLDRGYEGLEGKVSALGGTIERVK